PQDKGDQVKKMRVWIVLPASAIWLMASSLVCAQDTVAQFTQTQGGPEFKLVTDPLGDTTFSTTDTTSGVPISFTYFTSQPPVPNPQPGTLVLSAIATSSSFGSNFASIDFANPQDDT